ncbi:MAG: hypothetical protein KBD39_12915, partial [Sterolibacterium sp.]|nr:hypothetical protein [Sterolibacterium sp.]
MTNRLAFDLGFDLGNRFGPGFSRQSLQQMRLFCLAGLPEHISQTASAKLPLSRIHQTLSGELVPGTNSEAASRNFIDLASLAQVFLLSWSAHVRLRSVKNPQARSFYETEMLRCSWGVCQLEPRRYRHVRAGGHPAQQADGYG